jgi:hypothetical protein
LCALGVIYEMSDENTLTLMSAHFIKGYITKPNIVYMLIQLTSPVPHETNADSCIWYVHMAYMYQSLIKANGNAYLENLIRDLNNGMV